MRLAPRVQRGREGQIEPAVLDGRPGGPVVDGELQGLLPLVVVPDDERHAHLGVVEASHLVQHAIFIEVVADGVGPVDQERPVVEGVAVLARGEAHRTPLVGVALVDGLRREGAAVVPVQQRAGGAAVAEMNPIPAKPFDDGVAQVVGASTPGVAHQPVRSGLPGPM